MVEVAAARDDTCPLIPFRTTDDDSFSSMGHVRLESVDGDVFCVPRGPMHRAIELLEDTPGSEVPVPFPAHAIRHVLDFWGKALAALAGQSSLQIEEPLKSTSLVDCGFPQWARDFVDMPEQDVEQLLWVVDFLGVEVLLDVSFARIATCFLEPSAEGKHLSARAIRHLLERHPGYLPVHACPFAIQVLSEVAGPEDEDVTRVFVDFLANDEWQVRAAAKQALLGYACIGHRRTITSLTSLMLNGVSGVRLVAVQVLQHVAPQGDVDAVAALMQSFFDCDGEVRCAAVRALAEIATPGDQAVTMALTAIPADNDRRVLMEVASALQQVAARGNCDAVNRLVQFLEDSHWWTRLAAVEALAAVADKQHRETVALVLELVEVAKASAGEPLHIQWHVKEQNVLALVGISCDSRAFVARGEPLDTEDVYARFAVVDLMCHRVHDATAQSNCVGP